MAKKEELLDLAKRETDALLESDMAALDEQTQREAADAREKDALTAAHQAEESALKANNVAQYENVGQIISDVQGKIDTAKAKDETARRRENAYRYISGLGDTLSGVANLVGTMYGASNQNQTYNSHAVVQKAEEARKARKLEMEDLNNRLDELTARQRDLKASGSLAEAELKAKQAREQMALDAQHRASAEEAKKYADTQSYRAMRDAKEDWHRDRVFNRGIEEYDQTLQYNKDKLDQQGDKNTSKGSYEEFNLGGGEFVKVPASRMNEYNIVELYDLCPDGIKETAGKPKIDSYGTVVGYYPPTQKEMLQAINRAAQTNPAIKDKIRNLGKEAINEPEIKATAAEPVIGAKSGTDWSANEVKQG